MAEGGCIKLCCGPPKAAMVCSVLCAVKNAVRAAVGNRKKFFLLKWGVSTPSVSVRKRGRRRSFPPPQVGANSGPEREAALTPVKNTRELLGSAPRPKSSPTLRFLHFPFPGHFCLPPSRRFSDVPPAEARTGCSASILPAVKQICHKLFRASTTTPEK